MDRKLKHFFNPKSVAVIGASRNPQKLGYGIARNLIEGGYQGDVFLVNEKGGELFGKDIYKSIGDLPNSVDLAVVIVPAKYAPNTLIDCAQKGIKEVIISSGGFSETGVEGVELEKECLKIAQENDMRVIGPNCIGIIDTHLPLDTTFLKPPSPVKGDVAFISHSGALGAAIIDWSRGKGFSFSRVISLGNQMDLTEIDMLDAVCEDPNTKVITMYLEGVSNGRRFVEKASKVSHKKPVVVLKVGRSESGSKAAASHTGALAGQEVAFDAAFRRSGVIRANTTEEMFEWAKALADCPLPQGNKVAILTNAGGPGVTATDAVEEFGLELAKFTQKTINKLKKILPAPASLGNPVDMLASASPELYQQTLQILLNDSAVDIVMVIAPAPPMFLAEDIAEKIIPTIKESRKPVVVSLMGDPLIQKGNNLLRKANIPDYAFPETAASALSTLEKYAREKENPVPSPVTCKGIDKKSVQLILDEVSDFSEGFLDEIIVNQICSLYGLPIVPLHYSKTPDDAIVIADQLGYPVAMKIASPDISHKSDSGGLILNIKSPHEVKEGYVKIIESVKKWNSDAQITGVYIQKMIPEGQEVIVGGLQDSQFGAMVIFGSGGVEVESRKDVSFSMAPITEDDLDYMLNATWAGEKLKGFRNVPPGDINAVKDALVRLGYLLSDFPQIKEVEINPLKVLPKGEGVFAIDVRLCI